MSETLHYLRSVNGTRQLFRLGEIESIVKANGYGVNLTTIYGSVYRLVTANADQVVDVGSRPSNLEPRFYWFEWSPC